MANDIVSVWGGSLRIGRAPVANELLIGDGSNFKLETVDVTIDGALGGAQGSIAYRNATKWTHLSPGAHYDLLQTNGAGADPSWVTLGEAMTSFFTPLPGGFPFYTGSAWATLSPGPAGTILVSDGTLPVYTTLTNLLDADAGSSTGGVLYKSSSGSWLNSGSGPAGYVFSSNGTGVNPSWVNSWTTLYKTSSQSITSTTLTNDNQLLFAVATGGTYLVEGFILYNNGAGGCSLAVNGPSSFLQFSIAGVYGSTVAVNSPMANVSSTGNLGISFFGEFQANAAGTFALRHALYTAAGTTTIQAGSWIKYYRI